MSTFAAPAASFEARPAVFVEHDVAATSPGAAVRPVQPIRRAPTLGPNDRCSCGSGKKVKRCCRTAEVRGQRTEIGEPKQATPHAAGQTTQPEAGGAGVPAQPEVGGAGLRSAELAASPARQGETHTSNSGAPSALAGTAARPTKIPAAPVPLSEAAAAPIENPKSEIENAVPCPLPPDLSPLAVEGTGCAAWMRLTGLYPWKPLSLTERREALDRLIRHARRWFAIRKASGAFRPLISGTGFPVRPEIGGAGIPACRPRTSGTPETPSLPIQNQNGCTDFPLGADRNVCPTNDTAEPSALAGAAARPTEPVGEAARSSLHASRSTAVDGEAAPASPAPRPLSLAVNADPLDAQLYETLRDAVTIAEPSYELAGELEISEAKLNQLCRERSGLSAREWWDVSRAQDALQLIRAEIEAALDGAVLDRTHQIRKRGVQLEDLHRALRQHRRAQASTATERAYTLGFRTPARLNWALWVATRKTMQQHEAEILKEIFQTWSYNHHSCSLIAKNAEGEFKPQYEKPKPNYPSNPPINASQHKETTLPGPSQAPTPAHAHAA